MAKICLTAAAEAPDSTGTSPLAGVVAFHPDTDKGVLSGHGPRGFTAYLEASIENIFYFHPQNF